jgi:hypothetical protein
MHQGTHGQQRLVKRLSLGHGVALALLEWRDWFYVMMKCVFLEDAHLKNIL